MCWSAGFYSFVIICRSLKTSPKQPQRDPNLVRIIQSISSADTNTAVAALNELSDILENPAKQAVLKDYEEMYVDCICMQFKVKTRAES